MSHKEEHYFTMQFAIRYDSEDELDRKLEEIDKMLPTNKQLEILDASYKCID